MDSTEVIEVNSYIIIQRSGYFKLHQLVSSSNVMLGKDKVNLSKVVGKPYWTMFKMVANKGRKREFDLEECSQTENISEEILSAVSYGSDNRNISDDGSSQLLSSEDISNMRESGLSGQVILEKIVENSKTFKEKTEYSQEKYLKKKEKKYFEYIIIRKPSLRLIADIFYSRDQLKIMGLRHDTLSQILTAANIQHDGVYALFENGSQALVGAGLLSYISEKGLLINLTLGSNPQKQGILAMNFKKEKLGQLVNAKIKDIINTLNSKDKQVAEMEVVESQNHAEEKNNGSLPVDKTNLSSSSTTNGSSQAVANLNNENSDISTVESKMSVCLNEDKIQPDFEASKNKRKFLSDEIQPYKKPRWAEDFERAIDAFTTRKLNGIIIVAKEYPLNIITFLLPFLKPSCQLVVYCSFREPLVQLYIELKKRKDVIGIHLTETWLRTYQVLPNRTHPDVNMSFSGYLLIATKVL